MKPADDSEFLGKYEQTGSVGQWLIDQFFKTARSLLEPTLRSGDSVLEVGCGPGYSTARIAGWRDDIDFAAADLSRSLLDHASRLNPGTPLLQQSVTALAHPDKSFDALILLEVLEHLEDPDQALSELRRVARRNVLLSTPREPLWRFLNCARGKYLSDLGNTPGHIQHWSSRGLMRQVSRHFEVVDSARPVPWTILLLRPR